MALLCSLDSIVVLASRSSGLVSSRSLAAGESSDSLSDSKVVWSSLETGIVMPLSQDEGRLSVVCRAVSTRFCNSRNITLSPRDWISSLV